MTDLHAAIRERLNRFENEACYGGCECGTRCSVYGFEEMRAALLAVLDEHEHVPGVEPDFDKPEFDFGCRTCHRDSHCGNTMAYGWCDTTRRMAKKLGIEVGGDG